MFLHEYGFFVIWIINIYKHYSHKYYRNNNKINRINNKNAKTEILINFNYYKHNLFKIKNRFIMYMLR